jgi:hypothetical protein
MGSNSLPAKESLYFWCAQPKQGLSIVIAPPYCHIHPASNVAFLTLLMKPGELTVHLAVLQGVADFHC